jgi:hypothetical protein
MNKKQGKRIWSKEEECNRTRRIARINNKSRKLSGERNRRKQ